MDPKPAPQRALVLDDDPVFLRIASQHLKNLGLEVIACREIEAAEAVMGHVGIDVALTDLCVSPLGGLEGIRWLKHLATHFPQTRSLAVSANVSDEVRRLCRREGCSTILEKPLDFTGLRRALGRDLPAAPGSVQEMENLDEFLAAGTLRAVLQPIVSLSDDGPPFEVHAVESLARAPEGSLLRNPELLFAYASRKDRLYEADLQCIRAGLAEAAALGAGARLFLNVQPRSLTNPRFADQVSRFVREAGRENSSIVFELTEQETILNPAAFGATLAELRGRGFQVALDDFGVGFCSLRLVIDLKPDYLKLSGYFCRNLHASMRKQTVVGSTARMARDLGIPTIIECTETPRERDTALALGIDYAQGYLFSRPAPARDLAGSDRFRGWGATAAAPPRIPEHAND